MQLVFLVIQIILAIAIIGAVLLQKNGGDSLGSLGGGSGMNGGNIISGRSSANFLTKATTILMFCFMLNSLVLGNLSMRENKKASIVEKTHQQTITESDKSQKPTASEQIPVSE